MKEDCTETPCMENTYEPITEEICRRCDPKCGAICPLSRLIDAQEAAKRRAIFSQALEAMK